MATEIIKIVDTISPKEALQTMVEGRIRHLPVVTKDNEIVGMLSLRYLLHDRINELRDELQRLEAYFNDAQGG
jgi:CBS-domain-containing membrane protein